MKQDYSQQGQNKKEERKVPNHFSCMLNIFVPALPSKQHPQNSLHFCCIRLILKITREKNSKAVHD